MSAAAFATKNPLIVAGVAVGGILALWIAAKGFKSVGTSIGSGAVDMADGLISGAAEGLGGIFGVPLTDAAKGQAAAAAGNWWDASLYLPAPQFIAAAAGGVVDAANDPNINPLQPAGAWLGGAIYNLTH